MVPIRDPGLIGRKIDCPKCKYRFVVENPLGKKDDAAETTALPGKALRTKGGVKAEKPAAKSAGVAKGKQPRRRDEDEEDDEPPRKKKSGISMTLLLGIGLGFMGMMILPIVGVVVLLGGGAKDTKSPSKTPGGGTGTPPVVVDKNAGKGKEDPKSSPPLSVALFTGKRFALLVGVKDYDSKDLLDLSFPEADVEELADTLIADGYADENVVRMTKARSANDSRMLPTSANIRKQLDQLLGRCGKDDVVLVALTGHGIQCKEHKQFFCGYQAVLAEADDDAHEPKTLLAIEEVYQKLGGCPAALKLLLVDACRSDPFAKGGGRKEVDDLKSVTLGTLRAGVIALYSCSEGECSYETPELGHGVFFSYLIKGLKGDADMHQDGRITWTELTDYLVNNVDRYTESRLRLRQHPHFKGESNVDEPLAIRPTGRPTPSDKGP
jgi:hypothetical protein